MDYINFTKKLKQTVQQKMGNHYNVSIEQVLKNNGLTKDAILIRKAGANLSPNIYLEYFYERFCECESLDEISEEIIVSYHEAIRQKPKEVEDCFDFENYRQKLFFRVIHFESNKKLLANIPHIPYLDLAITFHCMVSDQPREMQFFTVSNLLQKEWGLSINELYDIAQNNTRQLFPAHIDTLEHIMEQLLWEKHSYQSVFHNTDFQSELSNIPDRNEFQMLVITNQYGVNGASVILYPNLLDQLAEKLQSDLYLLPSSIHEFIVLPADGNHYGDLSNMVSEVNENEVSQDEQLSDHVYFYDWKKHTLAEQVKNTNVTPT